MSEKSDAQLLREYAEDGNQTAFREIVGRHTDLIYSSALRQTTSPYLARDIAQAVFTDLARKAASVSKALEPNASILGWLFRSARFQALNQLRDDRRRQRHERQIMETLSSDSETAPEWDNVRPVLDGAMAELNEQDRDALLLRFFKNKDFRAIGEALGVSEDAAQKRVSRALERLRAEFARQGVTTTALVLSMLLPANAVLIAPAGLALELAAIALTGIANVSFTTAPLTKVITMTALQKTFVTGILIAAVATTAFQARQTATLRKQVFAMKQQQAPFAAQLDQLSQDYADATNRLAAFRYENDRLNRNNRDLISLRGEVRRLRADSQELARLKSGSSKGADVSAETSLLDKVRLLKERLEQSPEEKNPELQFLNEHDWLMAADRKLDSDADFKMAFSDLRGRGEGAFLNLADTALRKYMTTKSGQFPSDVAQLKPFFDDAPPDDVLQRYQIVPASSMPHMNLSGPGGWFITLKTPDSGFEAALGKNGLAFSSQEDSQEMAILAPAMKAAMDAAPKVNGRKSIGLKDIVPYLTTTEEQDAYQRMMERRKANGN
jgi:RNA polymerase sigma factor (sigma-70 family)